MPSYIPPQPQRSGVPREILIAAGIIGALLLVLIAVFILNGPKDGPATPRPTSTSAASGATTSPRPTLSGSPTNSSVPSAAATPSTLPSSTPNGTPSTAYEAFLLHVPESIRSTCVVDVVDPPNPLILFSTSCAAPGAITVVYTQYATADDMNAAYQDVFRGVEIDPDSGSCEDQATWPAESSYDIDAEPAGRRLCTDDGSPRILWSDDRLTILSEAKTDSADAAALIEFWTTQAGPLP